MTDNKDLLENVEAVVDIVENALTGNLKGKECEITMIHNDLFKVTVPISYPLIEIFLEDHREAEGEFVDEMVDSSTTISVYRNGQIVSKFNEAFFLIAEKSIEFYVEQMCEFAPENTSDEGDE